MLPVPQGSLLLPSQLPSCRLSGPTKTHNTAHTVDSACGAAPGFQQLSPMLTFPSHRSCSLLWAPTACSFLSHQSRAQWWNKCPRYRQEANGCYLPPVCSPTVPHNPYLSPPGATGGPGCIELAEGARIGVIPHLLIFITSSC